MFINLSPLLISSIIILVRTLVCSSGLGSSAVTAELNIMLLNISFSSKASSENLTNPVKRPTLILAVPSSIEVLCGKSISPFNQRSSFCIVGCIALRLSVVKGGELNKSNSELGESSNKVSSAEPAMASIV